MRERATFISSSGHTVCNTFISSSGHTVCNTWKWLMRTRTPRVLEINLDFFVLRKSLKFYGRRFNWIGIRKWNLFLAYFFSFFDTKNKSFEDKVKRTKERLRFWRDGERGLANIQRSFLYRKRLWGREREK